MKNKFIIIGIGMLFIFNVAKADLQSEMNRWFDHANVTSSDSGRGQQGGFWMGGGISTRNPPAKPISNQLIAVRSPTFMGGCNGVDLDLGGMAFADKRPGSRV